MRKIILVVAAIFPVTLGAGIGAMAAEPTSDMPSRIEACYIPGSGVIYRIKADGAPNECRSSQHIQFSWSREAGSGTGWELVRGKVTFGPNSFGLLPCPPGKLAVNGGGVRSFPSGEEWLVTAPGMAPDGSGWLLGGDPGLVIPAWVVCIGSQ